MLRQTILPCEVLVVLWHVRIAVHELVDDGEAEDEVVQDEPEREQDNGDERQRRERRVAAP